MIVKIFLRLATLLFWSATIQATPTTTAGDTDISLTLEGDRYTLRTVDMPLPEVISRLRALSEVPIDGSGGEAERITADLESLSLEDLIPELTDRYVLVRESGALSRVIIFEQGGEDALRAQFKESSDIRWRAGKAWREGDIRSAASFYEMAIAVDPNDAQAHQEYGRMLVMITNYPSAKPHLEQAANLKPDNAQVWLDLYSYYQRTLQLAKAQEAKAKAVAIAGADAIEQDRSGLWRTREGSIHPIL